MGRGGGGGGKGGGGGGRGGRGAAGGGGGGAAGAAGAADDAAVGAAGKTGDYAENQIYKESPSQMVEAQQNFERSLRGDVAEFDQMYADIPEPNVVIKDGYKVVEPGTAGAPKVDNLLSAGDAVGALQRAGVPLDDLRTMERAHGIDGMRQIGTLVANNPEATWINSGMEGMVFNWSESQVIRVQYNVGTPPPSYYVGKAGAYPVWKQNYGGVLVEGKEKIWDTISRLEKQGYRNPVGARIQQTLQDIQDGYGVGRWEAQDMLRDATLTKYVKAKNPEVRVGDAHANNWGLDFKGRLRVIDPGAYVPPGRMVTGQF